MKKIFLSLLALMFLLPALTGTAYAISLKDFKDSVFRPTNLPGAMTSDASTETKINSILQYGINVLFYVAGSLSVALIVYGGITYITAFGNEEKTDQAKNIIIYSLGGLIVMILAYAVVTTVIGLLYRAPL